MFEQLSSTQRYTTAEQPKLERGSVRTAGGELSELQEALALLGRPAAEPAFDELSDLDTEQSLLYRLFELSAAVLGLLALSPVMLVIALVLAIQRNGPIFYTQARVGRGGRLFTIYKFRTMRPDAEQQGPFICTTYSDPRITRVGQLLRKSKLDELPQLLNIIAGDMSFVGPRPERPHFHEQFSGIPQWSSRIAVKPGLTGLAQASKWISHDPEEKLSADLVYIRNRSLFLDLKIILFTLAPSTRPKTFFGIPMG